MQHFPVEIPEAMRASLRDNPQSLCEIDAPSARTLYARGLARMLQGRFLDARADFSAAQGELGDACAIELAMLDLRTPNGAEAALAEAQRIVRAAPDNAPLRARALHVVGLAHNALRHSDAAMDSLLKSAEAYGALGDPASRAQTLDTMGMVQEARGRLDYAMYYLSLSLVDKSLIGDKPGLAITLGNLGRVHLRAGRFADALECFRRDLEIATSISSVRGEARMHEDIGRALLGSGDAKGAELSLDRCIALARQAGFSDLEFFAHKDRALALAAQQKWVQAEQSLAAATTLQNKDPYAANVLAATRGAMQVARGEHAAAVETLEPAVRYFAASDLIDQEISARIDLAKALLANRQKNAAEACLLAGVGRARGDGYNRYLPALNEAMAQLDLVEGAADEVNRPIEAAQTSSASYVVRQTLGSGAFGEVFRVYDPERARDVALKKLHMERIYDVKQRARLAASAKVELAAASRVRHPGVVKVFAVGTESDGSMYVVQEFIHGRPLRALMPEDHATDERVVFGYAAKIAAALAALHDANVVHRDLKPENVLVRPDGSPVLVDFGIAQMLDQVRERTIAGTLEYMAPEQAAGKKIDGRADLYALGVMVYEWLAGVRPLRLRGDDINAKLRDLAGRSPNPITDFRPHMDPRAAGLVGKLLEKVPRRRPDSAEDVAEVFEILAEQSNTGAK